MSDFPDFNPYKMNSWTYMDYPQNADNRMEVTFENNQDFMNEYREEQREDSIRYAD